MHPTLAGVIAALLLVATSLAIANGNGGASEPHNPLLSDSVVTKSVSRPSDFEVTYPGGSSGVELAGTLTIPEGTGSFPAVLLIQGSGPGNRDEVVDGRGLFPAIADALVRQGVAVLRFDKRGIGKSTGNFDTATTLDFAGDAEAGLAFLRSRNDIRRNNIGLLGHSEGGLIAPMVAAKDKSVAFMVLMAAPAVKGTAILQEQGVQALRASGVSGARLSEAADIQRQMIDTIISENDLNKANARLQALNSHLTIVEGGPDKMIGAKLDALNTAWGRFFMSYDPADSLMRIRCPVLALNGSADVQVAPEQNLKAIRTALRGHRDVEIYELEGLSHMFRTVKKDANSSMATDEAIAPIALETIAPWVAKHKFDQRQR
jgi:pimeloyl-ACP methyl ester carboxylesterase